VRTGPHCLRTARQHPRGLTLFENSGCADWEAPLGGGYREQKTRNGILCTVSVFGGPAALFHPIEIRIKSPNRGLAGLNVLKKPNRVVTSGNLVWMSELSLMTILRHSLWAILVLAAFVQNAQSGDSKDDLASTHDHSPHPTASVCQDVLHRSVKVYAFSFMHALPMLDIRDGPAAGLVASPGVAKVNLNNDGILMNVVRLQHQWCPSDGWTSLLAVADETRTMVPSSPLNKLLIVDLPGGNPCGLVLRPFTRSGMTYVDADRKGSHTIYAIRHGVAQKICRAETVESDPEPDAE